MDDSSPLLKTFPLTLQRKTIRFSYMYIITITKLPTTRASACTNSASSLLSDDPISLKPSLGKVTRRVLKIQRRITLRV